MFKVKICGIREVRHLRAAVKSGASYVGFVFFEKSRRNVSIETAQRLARKVPKGVLKVALMVDPTDEFAFNILNHVPIDMLQLHGNETIDRVQRLKNISNLPIMKALGVNTKSDLAAIKKYEMVSDQILIDAKPPVESKVPGGLGKTFDWNILSEFQSKKPWLLAGGLTSKNVKIAIEKTGARQFDVSSGVEDECGVKSEEKIFEFINTLKGELDE
tara:strand:+ start:36 stop:683 length:648 start_codon:yes stop_codon:yes gene_type:complete